MRVNPYIKTMTFFQLDLFIFLLYSLGESGGPFDKDNKQFFVSNMDVYQVEVVASVDFVLTPIRWCMLKECGLI